MLLASKRACPIHGHLLPTQELIMVHLLLSFILTRDEHLVRHAGLKRGERLRRYRLLKEDELVDDDAVVQDKLVVVHRQ